MLSTLRSQRIKSQFTRKVWFKNDQPLIKVPTYRTFSIVQKKDIIKNDISYVKTAEDVVVRDVGMGRFIKDVYKFSGGGIAGSLCVSLAIYPFMSIGSGAEFVTLLSGFIGGCVSIYAIDKGKYDIKSDTVGKKEIKYSVNSQGRLLGYTGLVGSMGVVISPLTSIVMELDPMIVPSSVAITGLIFGGASLYAYKQPRASLLPLKATLYGALTGFIGLGLFSIACAYLFGWYGLLTIWHTFDIYVGIGLFSMFIASDTHLAIQKYKNGNPDHLGCAVEIYLDLMNILIRVMEILAKNQKK